MPCLKMISKLRDNHNLSVALTITLFVLIFFLSRAIPEDKLRELILGTGKLGPFVFIVFMLVSYILAPLSGSPLLLVGYYIFGSTVVFYAAAAGFLATVTNFWIARIWGKSVVGSLVGEKNIEKMDDLVRHTGLLTLFFIRMFQGGIHELVSYALGLTSIRFTPYFIVSSLSMIPGTILWYLLSLRVKSSLEFMALTFIIGFIFSGLFVVPLLATRKFRRKSEIIG